MVGNMLHKEMDVLGLAIKHVLAVDLTNACTTFVHHNQHGSSPHGFKLNRLLYGCTNVRKAGIDACLLAPQSLGV